MTDEDRGVMMEGWKKEGCGREEVGGSFVLCSDCGLQPYDWSCAPLASTVVFWSSALLVLLVSHGVLEGYLQNRREH